MENNKKLKQQEGIELFKSLSEVEQEIIIRIMKKCISKENKD